METDKEIGRFRVLSGSALKIIAVACMLCDHAAKFWLYKFGFIKAPLFFVGSTKISLGFLMANVIGRIAFPLFAFLAVEGYLHTRNCRRYMFNLLVFALLSTVPYSLAICGSPFCHKTNVLFTLLLGVASICAIDRFGGWKAFLVTVLSLAAAYVFKTDYGILGVTLIILMYGFKSRRELQFLSVIGCLFRGKASAGLPLAAIPIMLYNGERGFIKGRFGKYAFYAIYPLQFLVFYLLRRYC